MTTEKLKPRVRKYERALIKAALKRFKTRTSAAAALGITRETLKEKLK